MLAPTTPQQKPLNAHRASVLGHPALPTEVGALGKALLEHFAPGIVGDRGGFRLGISGLPGCGKSTLAAAMVRAARHCGWTALALSLDDFYLPQRERLRLAAQMHPLLAVRGVPGTHDLALLQNTMRQLPHAGQCMPVAVPGFDKGRDTRMPPSRWRLVDTPPRLLILEGWCLGVRPQSPAQLRQPINALERDEDRDAGWRHWVNARLREYLPLWGDLDARLVLRAPDWPTVCRWRDAAEQPLRQRHAPHAMSPQVLQRFLQHYERIGRHALQYPPALTDRVLALDARRRCSLAP